MVFQSALNAFNPVLRIWDQVWDTVLPMAGTIVRPYASRSPELLQFVQLDPKRFSHRLSA